MSSESSMEKVTTLNHELLGRRTFLRSLGKWSGARQSQQRSPEALGLALPQKPAPAVGSTGGGPSETVVGSMKAEVVVGSIEESGAAANWQAYQSFRGLAATTSCRIGARILTVRGTVAVSWNQNAQAI
jgi:hypothetical protein